MAIDKRLLDTPAPLLAERTTGGTLRVGDIAEAVISRIEERDREVGAFVWFDAEFVRKQAQILDQWRLRGRSLGPLHGIPVAVKDTIDTAHIPTESGSPIDKGRRPERDAAIVDALKRAGALIVGKTATSEFAYRHPPETKNPADPERTPGISSAGSAAAVAASMVPLAIGSQTGGSITTPASYCGAVGYKPTYGAIPKRGMRALAPSLDTPGVFASSVEGAAALAEALFGADDTDPEAHIRPAPRLLEAARSDPPVEPTFAFVRTPWWDRADEMMQAGLGELADFLGERCFEAELPGIFEDAQLHIERIMSAEMARSLAGPYERHRDKLSDVLLETIEQGRQVSALQYLTAKDWQGVYRAGIGTILERCDVIMTPAAIGIAPLRSQGVGTTEFARLWTFAGLPTITLPLMQDEGGRPMGVQLVGRYGEDGRLLRTARALEARLSEGANGQ